MFSSLSPPTVPQSWKKRDSIYISSHQRNQLKIITFTVSVYFMADAGGVATLLPPLNT